MNYIEEITALKSEIKFLRDRLKLYAVDPVFQILNRNELEIRWADFRGHKNLAIAYIDIDDLKISNSKFGLDEANNKIREAFKFVKQNTRETDQILIGRYFSGDEMLILCPKFEIYKPCERVLEGLKMNGLSATITISTYQGEKALTEAVKFVLEKNQECKLIQKGKIYWV